MSEGRDKKVSRLFVSGSGGKKKCAARSRFRFNPILIRAGMILLLSAATVFIAFPMPDSLLMGEIADRNIKADRDLMVKDVVATKEKQRMARDNVPLVFDLDDLATQGAKEQVHRLFSKGRTILKAPVVASPVFRSLDAVDSPDPYEMAGLEARFNATFNLDPREGVFSAIARTDFSPQVERLIFQLIIDLLNQGVVADRSMLFKAHDRGVLVRRIFSKQEELVLYPAVFPGLAQARRQVRDRAILFSGDFAPDQTNAIIKVAQAMIRPNLAFNRSATEERRAKAVSEVSPVYFQVKRGEIIVREGERVDKLVRMKLRALASQADRRDWLPKAAGLFLLSLVFFVVIGRVSGRVSRWMNLRDKDLLFLGALLLINLLVAFAAVQVGDAMARGFPGVNKMTVLYITPVAAFGMLATIFLGPLPGILFSIIASALTGLAFDRSLMVFLYFFIGTVTGLAGVIRVRERGAVIRSGLMVGAVHMILVVALCLIEQTPLSRNFLFYVLAGLLGGILAGIVVTGLIPVFEMAFRYTTNIKLLELANLDRPVLRELMVQAPGTYHHSVIVGAMVEAAAEAIGANPLLAKVSAYYHDLGKMKKPLYFVENQITGENKHDKLAPSMSALILISHIKDGVELARKHKLSPEIIDIIQQHHGTSLIAYFYQKAKNGEACGKSEIDIEDYRYPGPKPQTREAGLVMLADAVEAASRTLGEPNPARIQGMVQKLVNNIFSDGQLDECELTLNDLHLIARSFNKILSGIFHRRIEYPESAAKEAGSRNKAANGSHGKQSAKDSSDKGRKDKGAGKEDLKRLGIS